MSQEPALANASSDESDNEVWEQIDSHPDYFVSSLGRVYSTRTRRYLTPKLTPDGYEKVSLVNEGEARKQFFVHRLVLEAFKGKQDGLVANHINHNRSDNRLENLEWVTYSMNNIDTTSYRGQPFTFVESLPDGAKPLERYGVHDLEGYYACGDDLYKMIRVGHYRKLDARGKQGYEYYNVMCTDGEHTAVQRRHIRAWL